MAYDESGDVGLLKEGYLLKSPDSPRYLSVLKRWQKKWFRLMENGDFHYFDSEKSSKPVGTLHLLNCHRVFDPRIRGLQFSYCMGLEVGEATHYIKAETAPTFNAWLEMVAAIAEKTEVSPVSVSPSPPGHRRNSGLPEIRGHRGESVGSRALSISAKVQSRTADKSGWLYKTGPNNKGWNHRFFVLSNGTLSYFRTEKAEKSLGSIDLKECTAVNQATVKKGYGLTIQVPNRTYYISAEAESDQQEWIAAITMALSGLQSTTLSVVTGEAQTRSGSASSGSSVTSRDLPTSDITPSATAVPAATHFTEGEQMLHVEDQTEDGGQDKDSVVQLLEAEVDLLRGQVRGLHEELQSAGTVRDQLQTQLEESTRQREREVHSITVDRDNLHIKLLELEAAKQSLESVNDSLRLQLDEVREAGLEVEQLSVQGELEEAQAALSTAEEDIKTYQQELTDTQQLLQEIQSVALDLQAELIRRGDFVPDHFHKKRSLSSTASELLSSPDTTSASPSLSTHLECEERPEGHKDTALGDTPTTTAGTAANTTSKGDNEVGRAALAEERLKWQMEMENLRRECEAREEVERERCEGEVRGWREKVEEMEERCRVMRGEVERERGKCEELEQIRERVCELEGEVSAARERAAQLQVEKEKALTDLKNIRKINRSMEKKLSETGKQDSAEIPSTPAPSEQLEELSKQLELVQKERDQLRDELEQLRASLASQAAHSGGDEVTKLSPFRMRKTRATVAASRHSFAVPTVPSPLANGHPEDVPVKPQRPSRAVITKRLAAAVTVGQSQDTSSSSSRPRTWTATIFQNLLHS